MILLSTSREPSGPEHFMQERDMSLTIENDKNVYILGAGFSMSRGLPGIQHFMLRLRDAHPWLISHHRGREAEAVERVIQYRILSAAA